MKPRGKQLAFGLRPWSIPAFSLALSLLAAAIIARMLLSRLGVNFYFGTFLAASFFGGLPSGILAAVLSVPIVWWTFLPPPFVFGPLTPADYNQFAEFLLVSTLLIWFAHLCRQAP
jgi:Domain of unknown function (DUF4118)